MNIIWQEVLVHALAFLVLFLLMKKYAWGPLLQALDARSENVANELKSIARAKEEAEHFRADYQARLVHIEEEARARIQEALEQGKQASAEVQEKARADARAILEKAKQNMVLELEKAKIQVRDYVVEAALASAEKLIRREMTAQDHKRLVEEFVTEEFEKDS
ncbi:MAG: F0F1 ATP synthase subunit B [Candidatus Omnitrophica bacterium]|nr:F0F1 ATP synthase subunit B [Candidatus Omnitrophota bacterium]